MKNKFEFHEGLLINGGLTNKLQSHSQSKTKKMKKLDAELFFFNKEGNII